MRAEDFDQISHLHGLEFIEALLKVEERRFDNLSFRKGSTFEDINVDFGIFPAIPALPVYFYRD
jgi:hypothetical protein